MSKKVFVSSTVFDLVDIRAEVEHLLRDIGFQPLLSDSGSSEFQIRKNSDSIETCLANVRMSDYFIIILSRRYGPSLQKAGFDDISATHLEYNEAKSIGVPILFYIRDRLEAEYRIWKKNKNAGTSKFNWWKKNKKTDTLKYNWINNEKDQKLFGLIDEHQKLKKASDTSNWLQIFRNSIDLKSIIKRDLNLPSAQLSLEKAIVENSIPLIQGKMTWESTTSPKYDVQVRYLFTNLGNSPAYNVIFEWQNIGPNDRIPVIAPNETTELQQLINSNIFPHTNVLHIKYQTPLGHWIHDEYRATLESTTIGISYSLIFLEKKYQIEEGMPFEISAPDF